MLCQIVLTAIAISCTFSREITVHARGQGTQRLVQIKDVICVLLLSGLQKEDLDANTLAKLQRHNVNIYDMNNESQRQECLTKSYMESGKVDGHEVPDHPNDTSKTSTNTQHELSTKLSFSDNEHIEERNSEVRFATREMNSDDQTKNNKLKNLSEEMKIEASKANYNENVSTDNVADSRQDKVNTSVAQETIKQQMEPSLDSVMKFWAILKNKDAATLITVTSTTHSTSTTTEKIITTISPTHIMHNNQPKDIEYISKMIAEYLRTQSTPTTSRASRMKNFDIVSRTIKDFLDNSNKNSTETGTKKIERPISKDLKELSDLTEIGKLFEDNSNNKNDEKNGKPIHQQMNNSNEDNTDKVKESAVSPDTFDVLTDRKKQALDYINKILKVKNKFKHHEPVSSMGVTGQDYTENNNYERLTSSGNDYSFPGKVSNKHAVKEKAITEDFIKEIAEKVKDIVMKDIIKQIPTTVRTTPTTTSPTTTPPSTTENTKTVTAKSEPSVVQTLMELLKEINHMKDMTSTTTTKPMIQVVNHDKPYFHNSPTELMYSSVLGGFNPYSVNSANVPNISPIDDNHYDHNLVPISAPVHHPLPQPTYTPHTSLYLNNVYKTPALTIQTNSEEIPPLVIQVSKPMKIMNQHIIVTTQNPFVKQREEKLQRQNKEILNTNYADSFQLSSKTNHYLENPTYTDLAKKLRIAENVKKEFRESYKEKMEKIKERIEQNRDMASELKHPIEADQGSHYKSLEKSKHYRDGQMDPRHLNGNHQEKFNPPVNAHHRQTYGQPSSSDHRPTDSGYHGIMSRDFLSRLVDSNRHDVMSQVSEHRHEEYRPIDFNHKSRSHLSDVYERYEHERSHPRYKATKFHEKLEQIENMPHMNYESHSKSTTERHSDAVPSRQQLPLGKVKDQPRFDDSHFRNFLKSQQKVTDMLERILASKLKSRKDSSEA